MAYEMRARLSRLKDSLVDRLTRYVHEISLRVEKIKHNQNVILGCVQNQEAKGGRDQLMKEVKTISQKIHRGLKHLREEITAEERGPSRSTADFQIKKARKFRDVMGEYNQVQEEYWEKCKEHIQRQLRYAGKQVTEDEVEEMLESDNVNIFTQDILIGRPQKRQALGEIEARRLETMNLEHNIRELHEMFYDMQDEMTDRIEHGVENAAVHVESGRKEIRTAVQYTHKNRRLKCIICIVVTVVIVVILVIIGIIVAVVVAMQNR